MKILKKLQTQNTLIFTLVIALFMTVRLAGLGSDILNTDAERWYRRSTAFLEALKQHKYVETYQRYHPGVTLMLFNSIVEQAALKYQLTYTETPLTLEHADYFLTLHAASKAFNTVVLTGLLVLQLFFITKLFTQKTALIYGFLVSMEPYLIGINRWFHQTSFEVFFGFTALLALLFWYKSDKLKYLILSSLTLVFSVLAKVTSLILVPVLLVIFISKMVKNKKFNSSPLAVYGVFSIVFIFVLFPALWVDPLFVFNKTYGHVFNAVTDNVRADMITGALAYLYYPVILAFKLSPITLVAFVAALVSQRKTTNFNTKILIVSILNYFVFLTATDQKIDRYALIFFPFILLLISIYFETLLKNTLRIWFGLTTIFTLCVIYIYHPVYSAYYSPLFGSTQRALNLGIYDNSGEYFAQAALYLNTKPRATKVHVPDGISSFNLYFKGVLQRDYTYDTEYVVRSYDMQRLTLQDPKCTVLDRVFGSKEHVIVAVWRCAQ